MADDLVTWLREQLDDDERVAQAAGGGAWDLPVKAGYPAGFDAQLEAEEAHTTRWHPARVLAEVDAKRRILDLHVPWQSGYRYIDPDTRVPDVRCSVCHDIPEDVDYDNPPYAVEFPCPTLRLHALPYADRPGYRDEWKP